MKKILKITIIIFITVVAIIALAGMYKFNYLASKPGYDVDGNKIENTKKMHPSWDLDGDGVNDCEKTNECDHTIDYTKPKNSTI